MAKKITSDKDYTINPNNESVSGLRGIRLSDLDKQQQSQVEPFKINSTQDVDNAQGIIPDRIAAPINMAPESFRQDYVNNSKFDKNIGNLEFAEYLGYDINDLRDQQQTVAGKAVNALFNNIVIAGSTALLGSAGFLYGIGSAIANNDISYLGNNSVTQAEEDVIRWADETAPIYRGQAYQNKGFWAQLGSANFWADLAKNLGYTEGMLVPGMGVAGVVGKLGKVAKWIPKVAGGVAGAIPEASVEAVSNTEDQIEYKKRVLNDTILPQLREAAHNGDDLKVEELSKTYKDLEKTIEEDARRSSNFIFLSNIGLLTITNTFEFGSVFGKGFETGQRQLSKRLRKTVTTKAGKKRAYVEGEAISKKAVEDNAAVGIEMSAKVSKNKAMALSAGKKIADGFSEAFEEHNQNVIAKVPEVYKGYNEFNEAGIDPESQETVSTVLGSWINAMAKSFEDTETLIGDAQGLFTGIIGAPTYTKGKGIHWVNSAPQIIREAARAAEYDAKIATKLNEIAKDLVDDDNFTERFKGVIRHKEFEKAKNVSLYEGDKKKYKDAENAQFVSDVEMFRQAGEIEVFKSLLKNQADLTDEELQELINEEDGVFANREEKPTVEEARKEINERVNYLLNKIDSVVKIAETLNEDKNVIKANLDNDSFSTLVFTKAQLLDYGIREAELDLLISGMVATGLGVKVSENKIKESEGEGSLEKNPIIAIVNTIEKLLNNKGLSEEEIAKKREEIKNYKEKIKKGEDERIEKHSRATAGKVLTAPKRFNIQNILDFITGKVGDLDREERQILEDVSNGIYNPLVSITVASNEVMFDMEEQQFTPEDFNKIADTLTSSSNPRIAMSLLEAAKIDSKDFQVSDLETLEKLKESVSDRIRIAASKDFYQKEYNDLYKDLTDKKSLGNKVKEKVKGAVDKVANKVKAKKIREEREESGEDTSGKTDEELVEEEKIQTTSVEDRYTEVGTIRDTIVNTTEGLTEEDKNLLKNSINATIDAVLKVRNYSAVTDKEKLNILDEVIKEILDLDNYTPFLTGLVKDKVEKVKSTISKLLEQRKVATKREPIVPNPNAPQTPAPVGEQKLNTQNQTSNEKPPLDHLTNAFPELVKELKGTKYKNTPVDALPESVLKSAGVSKEYVNVVRTLRALGAYEAVYKLMPELFEKANSSKKPVAVNFIMLNDEEENPIIYHAVDVTGTQWAKDHYKQVKDINGKQYQVIGIQRENEKEQSGWLQEFVSKLREEAKDKSKWSDGKFISSLETHLTLMYRGELNTRENTRNIGEVLTENKVTPEEFVLGRVDPKDPVTPMMFASNDGQIHKTGMGDSEAKSGPFMVLPSANPYLYRYAQLTIPFLNTYLKNESSKESKSDFTNRIIDAFAGLIQFAKDNIGNMKNDEINSRLKKIYPLIFFGNVLSENGRKSDRAVKIGVQSFDNGDTVTVKIALFRGENQGEEATIKIQKDATAEEISSAASNYVFGDFINAIESDTLAEISAETGKKYPLIRINIAYPDHFASDAEALGLKGTNRIVAYKKYVIDNNLVVTNLGKTDAVGAGYALEKYDPKTGKFVKGNDVEQGAEKKSEVPQGSPRFVEPKSRVVGVNSYDANGKRMSIPVTMALEEGKLIVTNKDGEIITNVFTKAYRESVKQAMETGSPIPAAPEMFAYNKGEESFTAFYDETGKLTIMDRNHNYDYVNKKSNPELVKEIEEHITKIKSTKKTETKESLDPLGNLTRLKNKPKEAEQKSEEPKEEEPIKPKGNITTADKVFLKNNFVKPFINLIKEGMSLKDAIQDLKDTFKTVPESKNFGEEHVKYVLIRSVDMYIGSDRTISETEFTEVLNKFGITKEIRPELDKFLDSAKIKIERGKRYNARERRANVQRELRWLEKVLPAAAKTLQKESGFVRLMSDPRGLYVGKFMDGVIYISKNYATKGTVYHESFHFVFNCLIDKNERDALVNKVRENLGKEATVVECEEWLADNFADYIAKKNSLIRRIAASLITFFKRFFGITNTVAEHKGIIENMYDRIQGGEFRNASILNDAKGIERGKKSSPYDIDASIQAAIQTLRNKYPYFEATPNRVHKYIMVFNSDGRRNDMMTELRNSEVFKNLPIAFDPLIPEKLAKETGTAVDGSKHGLGVRYSYAQMKKVENLNEKLEAAEEEDTIYLEPTEKPETVLPLEEQRKQELIDVAQSLDTNNELGNMAYEMSIDELESFIHCRQ